MPMSLSLAYCPPVSSLPRLPLPRKTHAVFALANASCRVLRVVEIERWSRPHPGRRGCPIVHAGGGVPSTSSLILAFFLPLSLLIGTILVSIRIADNLDEKFLEELAMNQAMAEENEEEGEEVEWPDVFEAMDGEEYEEAIQPVEEEAGAAPLRARNRPKRDFL
ncbi:hypothetical protein HPP92_025000 [Vanilla planifolia]|uniref:Uncharacterized protein n=1 Tax=Vanilla planifolia TaxID=51239 RepID=A0A835UAL1_VANPL|nr:hypothetical protein HPP92_025000 [Vanilla planifolia]